ALLKAPAYEKALSPLLSVEGFTGYLLATVFLLTSFLPLYYRFGLGRGNLFHFSGLFALLLALAGLERLASGPLHVVSPMFTADLLRDPARGLLGLIGSTQEALGAFLSVVFVLAFLALLISTSLQLSTRFYDRKEL
ncbi:MAG: hypothetical protein OEW18_07495, partial [Candidatus Aminicenantes bacterium]|nr:hypothetical protein [Candidatus Aminicenantes bacterium]